MASRAGEVRVSPDEDFESVIAVLAPILEEWHVDDNTTVRRSFDDRSTGVRRSFDGRSTDVRRTFDGRSTIVRRACWGG